MSSRCRSKTFYLAPGKYREFSKNVLAALLPNGELKNITHRNGINALQAEYPDWDGMCVVVEKWEGMPTDLRTTIEDGYAEFWRIDQRSIEGKRPQGTSHIITKVAHKNLKGVGGKEAVQQLITNKNTAERVYSYLENKPSTSQAQALRFLSEAADVLTHEQIVTLVRYMERHDLGLCDVVVYPHELSFTTLKRLDGTSRLRVLQDVWKNYQNQQGGRMAAIIRPGLSKNHPWNIKITTMLNEGNRALLAGFANYYSEYRPNGSTPLQMFDLNAKALEAITRHDRFTINITALHCNATPKLIDKLVNTHTLKTLVVPVIDEKINEQAAQKLADMLQAAPLHRTDDALLAGNHARLAYALVVSQPGEQASTLFRKAMKSWTVSCRNVWEGGTFDTEFFGQNQLDIDADTKSMVWQWAQELEAAHKQNAERLTEKEGKNKIPKVRLDGLKVALGLTQPRPRLVEKYLQGNQDERQTLIIDAAKSYHKDPQYFNGFTRHMWDNLNAAQCQRILDQMGPSVPMRLEHIAKIKNYAEGDHHALDELEQGGGGVDVEELLAQLALTGERPENLLTVMQKGYYVDDEHYGGLALLGYEKAIEPEWAKGDSLTDNSWRIVESALADPATWPTKADALDDLPAAADTPWKLDQNLVGKLEGNKITNKEYGELDIHVISFVQELRENGNKLMKNCTAGYARRVQEGTDIILALNSDGRPVLNVNITKTDDGWEVGEINSYGNAGVSAPAAESIKKKLSEWIAE